MLHLLLLNLVVLAPFFVLGPLVAKRSLGEAAGWATIATAYATGAVVGGLVGLRWWPHRPLLAAVLVVVGLAPLIAGLAVAAALPVLALAGLLGGLQASLHEVLWNTSLQQHVPAKALSRVSAYGWLGALLVAPLGYVLAGPVADWIGVAATLWVGAAWVLVSTGLALAVPSIRQLQRTDDPSGNISRSKDPAESCVPQLWWWPGMRIGGLTCEDAAAGGCRACY